MRTPIAGALLALLLGCAATAGALRRPSLGEGEGELLVFLDPLPPQAADLAFQIESVAAAAASGVAVPLELRLREVRPGASGDQRLMAVGRLAPGAYGALLVKVRRAAAESPPAEPARVAASFTVGRRRATVVVLSLRHPRTADPGVPFVPSFTAAVPEPALAQVAAYCTVPGRDLVVVLDKITRRAVGAIPVGREPRGIALDAVRARAYVALAGEDRIAVVDVNATEVIAEIPLRAGDQPWELGVTPDGRSLVVVNAGSNTVSFLDPSSTVEIERVATGEEPGPLLLEPGGRRAHVLNRSSGTDTVLDLANRAVVATLRTDPEPLRARTNREGTRLYLVHAGSPDLVAFSLPDLQRVKRVHVGLGASALAVSFRNDRIYVGLRDSERLQIFDPLSLFPLSSLGLAAPAGYVALDEDREVLFALEPGRGAIEAVDLVSGRHLAAVEVGDDPFQIVLAGERR